MISAIAFLGEESDRLFGSRDDRSCVFWGRSLDRSLVQLKLQRLDLSDPESSDFGDRFS
jgi:hypothetical protein